ncbi:unnamed protein product, partial [Prorocentrum cordatum]
PFWLKPFFGPERRAAAAPPFDRSRLRTGAARAAGSSQRCAAASPSCRGGCGPWTSRCQSAARRSSTANAATPISRRWLTRRRRRSSGASPPSAATTRKGRPAGIAPRRPKTAACGVAPLTREESESTVEAGTDEAWNHSIVFFLPDAKGQQDDPFHGALFEVAAQEIARFPDVDCRHLECPSASLATDGAVAHVLLTLREAVAEVHARTDPDLCPERFWVFLVGHSFGGAVAIQAACDLPWLFQSEGGPSVSVAGVCTLDTSAHQDAKFLRLDRLQNARALLIASGQDRGGPADPGAVEDFEASRELFALLPATRKEMVTYCRSKRRGDMVVRLVEFVTRGLIGS